MRKTILLSSIILLRLIGFSQNEIHDAKINGIIPLGNKDVAAIQDLVTDCIYKSSPYDRGLLVPNQNIQIDLNSDLRNGEIIASNLNGKKILCNDQGCNPGNGPLNREIYDCIPIPSLEIIIGSNPSEEKKYDNALKALAVGLIDLTKDQYVCNEIKSQCDLQFDGDYNVLLDKLAQNPSLDLLNKIKATQKKYKHLMPNGHGALTSYIRSFKYYNSNAFPHVYIPYTNQVNHNQRPIIAINYNDDPVLEGFELVTNQDGSETLNQISIDENMASNRPVWVIAINERVDDIGNPNPMFLTANGCPPGTHPAPYQAPPSCSNGIQDGNETGVDCGGDCPPCETCNDGIMNGDETDIDCGGPSCPACPSCTDGIWNGNETGIDCGGPDCPVCTGISIRWKRLNISDKKEGWGNGKADIGWTGAQTYLNYSCSNPLYLGASSFGWIPGGNFLKVDNNELNTWLTPQSVGLAYISGYGISPWEPINGEHVGVVLYEEDRRNKFQRDFTPNTACNSIKRYYISKETPYGTITFDNSITWNVTNSEQTATYNLNGATIEIAYEAY